MNNWISRGLCVSMLLFGTVVAQEQESVEDLPMPTNDAYSTYQLAPGDRIRIDIFNHQDLSGDYSLDDSGRFYMPLIGSINASDLNPIELEDLLVSKLKPDYLVNPRIFIRVLNSRLYYLVGEVLKRGAFPYKANMTYLVAIVNTGGYTYRAKQDVVYVIRGDDPTQTEIKLSVEEKVQPGDIIRVGERLF